MYKTRPKRTPGGKILSNEYQSKELPNTRIQPYRRWFGNARVMNQKELEYFREERKTKMPSNYNVILGGGEEQTKEAFDVASLRISEDE